LLENVAVIVYQEYLKSKLPKKISLNGVETVDLVDQLENNLDSLISI